MFMYKKKSKPRLSPKTNFLLAQALLCSILALVLDDICIIDSEMEFAHVLFFP